MTTIATIEVIRTKRGGVFDICCGDDGLLYIRVNDGKENEAVMVVTEEETNLLGSALRAAAQGGIHNDRPLPSFREMRGIFKRR